MVKIFWMNRSKRYVNCGYITAISSNTGSDGIDENNSADDNSENSMYQKRVKP